MLGLPVDIFSKEQSFAFISSWFKLGIRKPKIIVTAYSEFFVKAKKDKEFAKVVKSADFVTADGRSVLAAVEYGKKIQKLKESNTQNIVNTFLEGVSVGGRILKNDLGETITGVWLFEKITSEAVKHNWRIFLLGGWDNLSGEVATMLQERFPGIKVAYDDGEVNVGSDIETNEKVIKKINNFKPDFLFVQYRPVVQEKWIANNIKRLKIQVAMGIGGTLDEYGGRLRRSPEWFESHGLKWAWRLWLQPKRWRRIIDAVIVFPWLVFKESLD